MDEKFFLGFIVNPNINSPKDKEFFEEQEELVDISNFDYYFEAVKNPIEFEKLKEEIFSDPKKLKTFLEIKDFFETYKEDISIEEKDKYNKEVKKFIKKLKQKT